MNDLPPFADDEDEEEFLEGIIRAKWSMDGATTLTEAADMLTARANYLRALEASGAQLTQPVQDDYAFYLPDIAPTPEALLKFGLEPTDTSA